MRHGIFRVACSDGGYLLQLTSDKRVPVQRLLGEGDTSSAAPLTEHRLSPEDRYTPEKGTAMTCSPRRTKAAIALIMSPCRYRRELSRHGALGQLQGSGRYHGAGGVAPLVFGKRADEEGEFRTFTFTVNKRTPKISDSEAVRIKPRERSKLNWDDKLTIEINGERPQCAAIRIEPDHRVPTLFLTGNSTVVDQDEEPWASWGQMIPRFFDAEVCFANYAESGECADTFIRAGRLKKALSQMKPGRLHVHGVRAQRPETKRTGQGSLLFLRHKPENVH